MPPRKHLRALLVLTMLATCCAWLVAAQGCGTGAQSVQQTQQDSKVSPQTNATSPTDTAKTEQSEPVTKDTTKQTTPAPQDNSQVDAVTAAAKAFAGENNPALGTLDVLAVKIVGNWARVDMQPQDKSTDTASCLLSKSNGSWVVVDFGTSILPSDYPAAPAEVFQ